MNKTAVTAFVVLLVTGMVIRVIAGTQSLGFVHPDEHQQYLEAANKIAYGYGVTFWEYERGVRHYLYPGFLAATLKLLDTVGLDAPVPQAQVIRTLMGLGVFGSFVAFSFRWLREGKVVAGLSLLAMSGLSPYVVFVGARTLSETAMIPLLLMMLFFLERRPAVSGILGGLMFAVRFQSALFVAPFIVAVLARSVATRTNDNVRKLCLPFALGVVGSLIFVGLIDYCTWGSWFHSPIEYFRANVIEHIAASFGVSPWYQYFIWAGETLLESSILIVPVALVGMRCKPHYAFAAICFFIAHSCIGHKEPRFMWPLAPILLILVAEGLEAISRLAAFRHGTALVLTFSVLLLAAVGIQFQSTDWHMGQTETSALALARVGQLDDVRGVALLGGDAHSGNFFYLRRNVPYIVRWKWVEIASAPNWQSGDINYLIASRVPATSAANFDLVEKVKDLSIFRVSHNLN